MMSPDARDVRPASSTADSSAWHARAPDDVIRALSTTADGLTDDEATRRRSVYGLNRLRVPPPTAAWRILIAQLKSVVVLLLIAAMVTAALTGERADAIAIAAVLALNTVLGFATELRARRAMEALRGLEAPSATVVRDGDVRELPAEELVPGDVIALEAGQRIPADARLIASTELRTVEAALTGEALPVAKEATAVLDAVALLAERYTMVFQGTAVVAGSGRAVVVATGDTTEVGRIGVMTATLGDEPTPLERRLDVLGRRLVWVALGVAAAVAGLRLARGDAPMEVFALGVALAVAAVPEGLPVVATVALAIGVARLARRRALVRRLPAVETLGSVTVVCTDKTGTLTAGEMTVTTIVAAGERFRLGGVGYAPEGALFRDERVVTMSDAPAVRELLAIGLLANRADIVRDEGTWRAVGDPTEAALIVAAAKMHLRRRDLLITEPEIGQVPFSSERQWMATFHERGDGIAALVKGAPERLIPRCTQIVDPGGADRPLDDAGRERWMQWNSTLAGEGLRVLALARTTVAEPNESHVGALTLVGLVGIADPPASGVQETIALLRGAGVRTVMLTGDQRLTAASVARELALDQADGEVVDGRVLAELDDVALVKRLERVRVVARVSPADKLRVVAALQARGEIVAMLGDGVNDAAALRKADIGVAMGVRGTDVAKDAADMVLADDRFVTVGAAVEEGRVVFDNIRKFVFYLFSCNLAEVFVLCVTGMVLVSAMLTPLQILWLNLVTDTFPALALAIEPAEPRVMRRPPRDPGRAILSASFLRGVSFYAVLIAAVALAAAWVTGRTGSDGRTAAFMTLALAQAFHLGNGRSRDPVVAPARAFANRWAVGAVVLVVALQVVAVLIPAVRNALGIVPLDARTWSIVVGLSLVPALIGQALKLSDGARHARAAQSVNT